MTIQQNVFGELYDDAEPCFLTAGGDWVFNRVTREWLKASSLAKHMVLVGWNMSNNEVGVPSQEWSETHGVDAVWGPLDIPILTPGYKIGVSAENDMSEVSFLVKDGPSTGSSEVVISGISVDGSPFADITISISDGFDDNTIAATIAVEITGKLDTSSGTISLSASAADDVVTMTATGGNSNLFDNHPTVTVTSIQEEPQGEEPPSPPSIPDVPSEPWATNEEANAWYDAYLAEFGNGNTIAGWDTMTIQEKHDAAEIIVANDA